MTRTITAFVSAMVPGRVTIVPFVNVGMQERVVMSLVPVYAQDVESVC